VDALTSRERALRALQDGAASAAKVSLWWRFAPHLVLSRWWMRRRAMTRVAEFNAQNERNTEAFRSGLQAAADARQRALLALMQGGSMATPDPDYEAAAARARVLDAVNAEFTRRGLDGSGPAALSMSAPPTFWSRLLRFFRLR